MKEREEPVMVHAVHATRKDRKGNPVTKSFTLSTWESLHDDNWSEVDTPAPAPLKSAAKKVIAKTKPKGKK